MSNNDLTERRAQKLANLSPKQQVGALLKQNKNAIGQVLPKHISPERLMQVAFSAIRTTPKLLQCHTDSLIGGIIQCAQLGLEPNTALGHCYLIPFKDQVQVIIGYKGLIDLARRSGQIVSIAAHVVRENDDFTFELGLEPKLRHIPGDDSGGVITHAYAVAHFVGGGNAFEVMTFNDIQAVMLSSQSRGKYGPWLDHFPEMARKTAIRRLSKFLPLSIEFATAVSLDAKAETGKEQHLNAVLTGEYEAVEDHAEAAPATATSALKDKLQTGPAGAPPPSPEGSHDSNGELFDAEIHVTDADGQPVFNKGGDFRKRPTKAAKPAAEAESEEVDINPPAPTRPASGRPINPTYEGAGAEDLI